MDYLIVTLFDDFEDGRFLVKIKQDISDDMLERMKQKFNKIKKNVFYDNYENYLVDILNELDIEYYSIEDFKTLELN